MTKFACTDCGQETDERTDECDTCGSDAIVDMDVSAKCSRPACPLFAIGEVGGEPLCNMHFAQTIV